ncbi:MAG TPA: C1 family peptidase [Phycisphaerales bacterium]|nr:C1 family peptidase [Phycisphaerales bacterium]
MRMFIAGCLASIVACVAPQILQHAPPATAPAQQQHPATAPAAPVQAASIDLRPRLRELDLQPRPQGSRGTCSIFTTCEAIEFALAVHRGGKALRLSPEYLNWAAGQAAGGPSDGNFFHNALAGFERHGICAESKMPYQKAFDPRRAPSTLAADEATRIREESREALAIRWIVPWQANSFGVNDEQFAEIKRIIALGYPVAAGSGHSRLLVGYRDDPVVAGGGAFITEDSALNRFDEVTYEFVRTKVADVFWIEALSQPEP